MNAQVIGLHHVAVPTIDQERLVQREKRETNHDLGRMKSKVASSAETESHLIEEGLVSEEAKESSSAEEGNKLVNILSELQTEPNKICAAKTISKGQLIFIEKPTIVQINKKSQLFTLAMNQEEMGVFKFASNLKHSCTPNIEHFWDSKNSLGRYVASRDIAIGEELTIAYVDLLQSVIARQGQLKEKNKDHCNCTACDSNKTNIRLSDCRRKRIQLLDEQVDQAIISGEFESAVRYVKERMLLLRAEGLDSPKNLLRCEYDGFRASLEIGNIIDSEKFYELACEHSNQGYGEDSIESSSLQIEAQDLEFQRAIYDAVYN